MDLSMLKPAKGSVKKNKRLGRGSGSGKGGTSTRGHKGQKAETGFSVKAGFEGGQMPLQRRVPKFGFNNINRVEYKSVNIDMIEEIAAKKATTNITKDFLYTNGVIPRNGLYKVLGRGDIKTALTIEANAVSKTASEKITKAGGSVKLIK